AGTRRRLADRRAVGVLHAQVVIGTAVPAQLDRDRVAAPRCQRVVPFARGPLVKAAAVVAERPGPVAEGDVAGAGEAEEVARRGTTAEHLGQRGVNGAAALAVAPG